MAGDPITAIANAISEGLGIAKPIINEALAQKYENEHRENIKEFNAISNETNPVRRADDYYDFTRQLLERAGQTFGSFSGASIEIPVEYYRAFVEEVSEGIMNNKKLNKLQFTKE